MLWVMISLAVPIGVIWREIMAILWAMEVGTFIGGNGLVKVQL